MLKSGKYIAEHDYVVKKKTYQDELVDEIKNLAQSQGLNHVFTTFLEIAATCISAQMDPPNAEEREKRYEEMTSTMEPKILNCYAHMLALLALAIYEHEEDPCDILGSIYYELRLNNEWNGQYFTLDHIRRLMAQIVNPVDERSEAEEPIMISEPTCDSGTMVIGAVWAMKQKNFDFRHKSFFVAQDIDIRCVWMAYIQLSLYENSGCGHSWRHFGNERMVPVVHSIGDSSFWKKELHCQ